jgi:acetoin utilization deacetylase AcuC-like enzyme
MPPKKTGVHIDARYLNHHMPPGHPERTDRIRRLLDHGPIFDPEGVVRMGAGRRATREELTRVHDPAHIEYVASTSGRGHVVIDPDTHTSELSYETALLAAGGVLDVADAVMAGDIANGAALVRPPGHHAEANRAMGFCLFNNVAVAAFHLLESHGLGRVLVLDWDVHHGNGTQWSFYDDDRVLFVSVHQYPCYPGTGAAHEVGEGKGEGFTVNVPLAPGCGDAEYTDAFETILRPIANQYKPEFVLVSAGFDAHRADPLAEMNVTEDGYARMTSVVLDIARDSASGRVVAVLEGGYHLDALAASVETMVDTMRSDGDPADPSRPPSHTGSELISSIREVHSKYWEL